MGFFTSIIELLARFFLSIVFFINGVFKSKYYEEATRVMDKQNNKLATWNIPYGAKVFVKNNKTIKSGEVGWSMEAIYFDLPGPSDFSRFNIKI